MHVRGVGYDVVDQKRAQLCIILSGEWVTVREIDLPYHVVMQPDNCKLLATVSGGGVSSSNGSHEHMIALTTELEH